MILARHRGTDGNYIMSFLAEENPLKSGNVIFTMFCKDFQCFSILNTFNI